MQIKEKEHKGLNSGARASLLSITSNVLCRGIGFLFTPIFTRILSPAEYGIYPLYTSLMGVFTVIITLEVSGGFIYRFLSKFPSEKRDSFLSSLLGAELVFGSAFTILYLVFRREVNTLTSLSTSLSLVLFLQIFLSSAEGIYFAKWRYEGKYTLLSVINIVRGIATPLLSLLLIRLGLSGKSRIYSPLFVSALISIPIIAVIIKRGRILFQKSVWRYIFKLLLPMLPHYLATSLIAGCDKIIIARVLSDSEVGRYSAVYSIGFMSSLVTGGLMLVLTPWLMKKLKAGQINQISLVCRSSVKIIIFATLLFLSVLPEVLKIVVAPEYYESGAVAYLAALAVIFSFLASFFGSILLYYEKPFIITRNSLTCAAVTVFFSVILIKRIGILGGAVMTLVSYIILFIENAVSVYKSTPHKSILKLKGALSYFAFAFIFAGILFFLKFSLLARAFIAAALLLMLLPSDKSYKKILT